jgi:23S rRNA (cytidine1920-2'-O)/16S rRNA (cytidine1409-2'-O)-methyltransferase
VKLRLDDLVLKRGLAESKTQAQALILAGKILIDSQPADKAGDKYSEDVQIQKIEELHPFVSRGGVKLTGALEASALDVSNKIILDVGSSTGGFMDALLQKGAAFIYGADVGYGQLAWKLQKDSRVHNVERFNARYLTPEIFSAWQLKSKQSKPEIVVMDVSFISILKIIPALIQTFESFTLLSLVKPQFEAGREQVEKGGLVKDPAVHREIKDRITQFLTEHQFQNIKWFDSVLPGGDGNQEYFVYAVR